MIPVPEIVYASKFEVILPMLGKTLLVIIWIEYSVLASKIVEN